jgi:hypothetical protein
MRLLARQAFHPRQRTAQTTPIAEPPTMKKLHEDKCKWCEDKEKSVSSFRGMGIGVPLKE